METAQNREVSGNADQAAAARSSRKRRLTNKEELGDTSNTQGQEQRLPYKSQRIPKVVHEPTEVALTQQQRRQQTRKKVAGSAVIANAARSIRKSCRIRKEKLGETSNSQVEEERHPYKSQRIQPVVDQPTEVIIPQQPQGQQIRKNNAAQNVYHERSQTSSLQGNNKSSQQPLENTETANKRKRQSKKKIPDALGGKPVPSEPSKLKEPTYCVDCGAKKFQYETKGMCCCNGDIKLACNEYPEELMRLYTARDDDCLHFQTYSRLYNNLFAFSSLGGTFQKDTYKGIYVFKAQGQVYHYLPDLIPMDTIPRYLQLYFYDGQHEKENRLGLFPNLKEQIITLLMGLMDDNPYDKFFRSLKEIEVTHNTRIVLTTDPAHNQHVYNAPTSDEVAVVWPDNTALEGNEGPHIIAYGNGSHTHTIRHFYGCYDPLQYPLLLPRGECGWHQGLKKQSSPTYEGQTSNAFPVCAMISDDTESLIEAEVSNAATRRTRADKRISCREYYVYKFQIRPGNLILRSGRLFQQFIVDMYVKIENTRLDFLRLNQKTIRADLYQGILDTLELGENSAGNVGKRIVLPPSFLGGPRDMRRRYLNAMVLVQKYGKPDLFITITCNPNWPEIKAELATGEQAQNRPDLVARIFHAKLTFLKKQLKEKKIFGEVAAMINVVEFQKRGLPHAHFLVILKTGYKITCLEKFDQYVSAEIPSTENPHLRATVIGHMMHGPCGDDNPTCACMKNINGKRECSKGYPKKFRSFTTNGTDCYPLYKRQETGETILVRKTKMDNRSVIPYNPYLLAMFDCHLNVEVCSTINAVKYLYKYVYKGHDRVLFNVENGEGEPVVDEIHNYQSGRWVSPPEAAWRIFGFNLFDIYPPVQPLPVHTPNNQMIRFAETEDLATIAADEQRARTMLTAFFETNVGLLEGEKYLYSEFPQHFVWVDKTKKWKKRGSGVVIGRVAHASPGEGERYYLRLLLAHVKGPKSFDDLQTVNKVKCATFQEAALKRGILEEDNAAEKCMEEAIKVEMPHALRRLFATILIFSCPNNPADFWLKYYGALSEDFEKQMPGEKKKILQLTASKVEQFLEGMGKRFVDFNLEHVHIDPQTAIRSTRDISDALNAPVPLLQLASRKQLNTQQRIAYKAIMHHVKGGTRGAFFIDGPGGTGKTFLYGALYAKVRSIGKICLPTATSGIAASNLLFTNWSHNSF